VNKEIGWLIAKSDKVEYQGVPNIVTSGGFVRWWWRAKPLEADKM
jgi:hypothetical protein